MAYNTKRASSARYVRKICKPTPRGGLITSDVVWDQGGYPSVPVVPVLQLEDESFAGIVATDDGDVLVVFDTTGQIKWTVPNHTPLMTTFGGGLIAKSVTGTYSFDRTGIGTGQLAVVPMLSWQGNSYQIGSVQSLAVSWLAPGVPLYASFVGGYPSGQGTSPICRDDRDRLTAEYADPQYKAAFLIPCNRFVSSTQFSMDHPGVLFDFATLNGSDITHNDYPGFGLFEKSLLDGLGAVQANYGNQPLVIGSAFRSPKVNQLVEDEQHTGRHPNGRHIYGDAADLETGRVQTVWDDLFRAANGPGLKGACVEPLAVSKVGHVHIDWRPKGMVKHNCLPDWLVK